MFIVQRLIYSAIQWFIQPTERHGYYTITAGASPPPPGAPGFRRDIDRGPQDVVNARLPGEWQIGPVEGLDGVYQSVLFSANPVCLTNQFQRIHPFNVMISIEELLGTEGDQVNSFPLLIRMTRLSVSMQVVIQTFPVGAPRDEMPSWNITPVLD